VAHADDSSNHHDPRLIKDDQTPVSLILFCLVSSGVHCVTPRRRPAVVSHPYLYSLLPTSYTCSPRNTLFFAAYSLHPARLRIAASPRQSYIQPTPHRHRSPVTRATMSSSINIPTNSSSSKAPTEYYAASTSYNSTLSSSAASTGYRPSTPHPRAARLLSSPKPQPPPAVPSASSAQLSLRPAASPSASEKMKGAAPASPSEPVQRHPLAEHRRSLMGSEIARAEHLVVDVGTEEAPRVVSSFPRPPPFPYPFR
jgi:hypothetical protein